MVFDIFLTSKESKKDATKGGNVPSRPPPPKISEKSILFFHLLTLFLYV